uniref:Stanniocalcin n=1 Tax=Anabas testudineus TaxID=64144 RepID=A0A7N6BNG4_ANATE
GLVLDRVFTFEQTQNLHFFSLPSRFKVKGCLVSSGDVGCGMFQCFNNSCEIQGLHHICLTLLHNAGRYDSQGKSFVKDALRCLALGLRQRFSCVSRRCSAVKEMVFSLQRDCYSKHRLCLALQDHMETIVNLNTLILTYLTRSDRGSVGGCEGSASNTGGRCAAASAAPVLSANRTSRSSPQPHLTPCPGPSLLRNPCSSQPVQMNQMRGMFRVRSTTLLNLVSTCFRKPMLRLHRQGGESCSRADKALITD